MYGSVIQTNAQVVHYNVNIEIEWYASGAARDSKSFPNTTYQNGWSMLLWATCWKFYSLQLPVLIFRVNWHFLREVEIDQERRYRLYVCNTGKSCPEIFHRLPILVVLATLECRKRRTRGTKRKRLTLAKVTTTNTYINGPWTCRTVCLCNSGGAYWVRVAQMDNSTNPLQYVLM